MKILKPFEEIKGTSKSMIMIGWLLLTFVIWGLCSSIGTTHMFPTISQVLTGFTDLYNEGLVVHIVSSLGLCFNAVFLSVFISLILCYLSPIAMLKPMSVFISKLRYLPLAGISFYVGIYFNDARSIQVWVLVIFMTTYLVTSLLGMITDIPKEEFDHARTLGCSRLEILWEVVIKGRFDYVIELVRQNFAIVWMMLVSIESILMAAGGLGTLIKNGDKLGNNGRTIAVQIIIILIGVIFDTIMNKSRKLIFRYSNF
jgi:ABC-type nitrate/sulfonate/bicarbonate transport system permease component